MKTKLFAAAAAFAVAGLGATSALATTCTGPTTVGNTTTGSCTQGAETVSITTVDETGVPVASIPLGAGFKMIDNFDSIQPGAGSGFTVSGGNIIAAPGNPSLDAEPPGDLTAFESVEETGNPWVLTDTHGALSAISFYMGSPDQYNGLNLQISGVLGTMTLAGAQIWGGTTPVGNFGNQADGYLVTLRFAPNAVKSLTFTSTSRSFEFDNVAGISVPEPASWALMIMGFGAAGAMLRGKRRSALSA